MKIWELIELLKEYNPNAEVTTPTSETILVSYICGGNDGEVYSKKDTPIVFIEPSDCCIQCVHEYNDTGVMMCSFYEKPCKEVGECFQFEEFIEP